MGRGGWQEEGDGGGVGRGWGKGISKLQAKAGYGYSSSMITMLSNSDYNLSVSKYLIDMF